MALAESQISAPVSRPSSATAAGVTSASAPGDPVTCSRTRSASTSIEATRAGQTLRVLVSLRPSAITVHTQHPEHTSTRNV